MSDTRFADVQRTVHKQWGRCKESTSSGSQTHAHLHVRLLAHALHRLHITPRQLFKAHHAPFPLLLGTRWGVAFLGAGAFIVPRRVAVAVDGVRGREAIQKHAGLVQKVESLEDIPVRHARRIGYVFLVLVLTHRFDDRNRHGVGANFGSCARTLVVDIKTCLEYPTLAQLEERETVTG